MNRRMFKIAIETVIELAKKRSKKGASGNSFESRLPLRKRL